MTREESAAVTLTPQSSDPRHGTRNGYYMIPCRDQCCRAAAALYERRRSKLRRMGRPYMVSSVGAQRRVHALQAMGWRLSDIAATAGISRAQTIAKVHRQEWIWASTHAKIIAAYDQLSMRAGPSELARLNAARKGWPPPLAWDDDLLDDPTHQPYTEAARTTSGRPPAVHAEDVEWLHGSGLTLLAIAERLHVDPKSIYKALTRAGRNDLWDTLSAVEKSHGRRVA